MIWSGRFDAANVAVYKTRAEMGDAAAAKAGEIIRSHLNEHAQMNVIFASAPSQNEFLEALAAQPEIAWERIRAFHMDEYFGLAADAPQGFGNYLKERLFSRFGFQSVHYLDSQTKDPEIECERYSQLLRQFPPDLVCMGIGENGHLAFNDPHEARFDDERVVRVVTLDLACRTQQVNDGCFSELKEVPEKAMTLTIPAMTQAARIVCIVPGARKAAAVKTALSGPVAVSCPASILRRHPAAFLFLDAESAQFIHPAS